MYVCVVPCATSPRDETHVAAICLEFSDAPRVGLLMASGVGCRVSGVDPLITSLQVTQGVFMLPSLIYSAALAQFFLADSTASLACGDIPLPGGAVSVASVATARVAVPAASGMAASDFPPSEQASLLLQQALLLFPEMLEPLVAKCADVSRSPWSQLLAQPCFADAGKRRLKTIALEKLITIYVDKNSVMWKAPAVRGRCGDSRLRCAQSNVGDLCT
jgi:hypothetical protein